METTEQENIAQTVIDVMNDIGHVDQMSPDDNPEKPFTHATVVGRPKHRQIEDVTKFHRDAAEYLKPARRQGTARLTMLDSMIIWTNRFKGETSALFASLDASAPSLTCIADYHASGSPDPLNTDGDPTARHCKHRAIYNFPLSKEWKAWMAISGQGLDKDDMGEFIEQRAMDIMNPTPAILSGKENAKHEPWENSLIRTATQIDGRFGQLHQLLAMSRKFQVYETSNLTASSNRDTGEQTLEFASEHKDANGEKLVVPNLIILTIPVFEGGTPYRMTVRFRYRKAGGAIKFIMSIYNPERAFNDAIKEAAEFASDETALPLFYGAPES